MAVRDRLTPGEWRRVGWMAAFILLLHVVGFGILGLLVVPGHYHVGARAFGFGTGVLAYTLGLLPRPSSGPHARPLRVRAATTCEASPTPRRKGRCCFARRATALDLGRRAVKRDHVKTRSSAT